MAYATPQRFIREYGLEETTQLLADEQQLLTSQLLSDALSVATGGVWTGSPSAADMAVAVAALDRLTRKLATSANFMDGYLRAVVTLPLAADDANASTLEDCNAALARCLLADDADNATERMDKCCDQWRVWLRDVQAGRVALVTSAGAEVAGRGRIRSGQATTGYNWGAFPPTWGG